MKCPRCKWNYPEDLLSRLFLAGRYSEPICGICAEEIIGIPLHGEIASQMRDDAQEWRINHPRKQNDKRQTYS